MLRNLLTSLILPGVIVAVIALNYQRLLEFAHTVNLKNQAQIAIKNGQWEKVVGLYANGWKVYPTIPDLGVKLAWAYRQNKQIKEAEAQYRQVLLRFPNTLNARMGLMDLLKTQPHRLNEAIDQARAALRDTSNNGQTALLNQVGDLYADRAQMPEENRDSVRQWLAQQAIYYYERSLEKNPKQFDAQFHLGLAEHQLKHWEPAAKAYCQALLLQPRYYQARYNLGMALSALNYHDAGFRQLDRSVAILAEDGRMDEAMKVALQVQNIKNSVYESRDKPKTHLAGPEIPPFLKEATCLTISPTKDEKMDDSSK
jgi:tetratricopeptide (TPR) repeat protein